MIPVCESDPFGAAVAAEADLAQRNIQPAVPVFVGAAAHWMIDHQLGAAEPVVAGRHDRREGHQDGARQTDHALELIRGIAHSHRLIR